MGYVTWTDLFQLGILICSVIAVVISILGFNHKD